MTCTIAPEPRRCRCGTTAWLSQKTVPTLNVDHRSEQLGGGICDVRRAKRPDRVHQCIGDADILRDSIDQRCRNSGVGDITNHLLDVVSEALQAARAAVDGHNREPIVDKGQGCGVTELSAGSDHNRYGRTASLHSSYSWTRVT